MKTKDLIEGDKIFHLFNMELVDASEGYACVRTEVQEIFLNAHRIAHGGLIFALLDVAFALAANSVIEAVGVQWSFNVIRSAALGDHVRAEAKIIHKGKRSLVVELKAYSEKTNRLLAQGMATALPFSRK